MIMDLGLIDYREAYEIQREFVRRRKFGEMEDSVILAEHPAVFTLGRRGSKNNLLVSEESLREKGIMVLRVDRGGDITFHGQGQLIVYPIIDLKHRVMDMHLYLRDLEELALGVLKEYGISAWRCAGRTGVWASGGKIASIGIAATDWVTYHGLSINVDVHLGFFAMINPCGMRSAAATSMEKVSGRDIVMDDVKGFCVRHAKNIFGIGGDRIAKTEFSAVA